MMPQESECKEDVTNVILHAIGELNTKMDNQTELLKNNEKRIEANIVAIKVNKEAIWELQAVNHLRKCNSLDLLWRLCTLQETMELEDD